MVLGSSPRRPTSSPDAYARGVKKQTSILLDVDLVREVAEILGTENISDTIHALLEERAQKGREATEGEDAA